MTFCRSLLHRAPLPRRSPLVLALSLLCLAPVAHGDEQDFHLIYGIEYTVGSRMPVGSWRVVGGQLSFRPQTRFHHVLVGSGSRLYLHEANAAPVEGSPYPAVYVSSGTAIIRGSVVGMRYGVALQMDGSSALATGNTRFFSGGDKAVDLFDSMLSLDASHVTTPDWTSTAIALRGGAVELRNNSSVSGGTGIQIDTAAELLGNPAGASHVLIDGSRVEAIRHAAIDVRSGNASGSNEAFIEVRNNAQLESRIGLLMMVSQQEDHRQAVANLSVLGTHLHGNIVAEGTGVANVALAQGGTITGTFTQVGQVDVQQGGRWELTGDSDVHQLTLAAGGSVSLGSGDRFNTLDVKGDLHGNGGTLHFNTVLAGDDADSDRVQVAGGTHGHTHVAVRNVGGEGAQTHAGIALITVGGPSDGHFQLQGRAVGGAYEYFLHKGGVTGGEGNWYLRSQLPAPEPDGPCDADPAAPGCGVELPEQCMLDPALPGCAVRPPDPDPCEVDPSRPACAPVLPAPVLRPEIGAYLGNQQAMLGLFRHRAVDRDGNDGRAWAQLAQSQGSRDLLQGQMALQRDERVLRVGTDVLAWGQGGHVGVMLASGDATTRSRSRVSGYAATGKVDGHALAVYAGWQSAADVMRGSHVSGWVQRGRFDNRVQGEALDVTRYASASTGAAVEAGHRFVLRSDDAGALTLQPRLQLGYTQLRMDGVVEGNGTVIGAARAGGWNADVGLRLQARFERASATFMPYAEVVGRQVARAAPLQLNGERVVDDAGRRHGELLLGVNAGWENRWRAQAELGWGRGDGQQRSNAVQVRVQRHW